MYVNLFIFIIINFLANILSYWSLTLDCSYLPSISYLPFLNLYTNITI